MGGSDGRTAGWYLDPEHPSTARWWDGTRWTDRTLAVPGGATPPTAGGPSVRTRPGVGTVLLRICAALVCLCALLGGGLLGLLIAAGLVALAAGTTALLRGRSRVLPIPGRRAGFGVLAAGLTTVLLGGTAVGAPHPTTPRGSTVALAPATSAASATSGAPAARTDLP